MVKASGIDRTLLAVSLLLIAIGFLMIFSTTPVIAREKFGDSFHFFNKQLLYLFLGCLIDGFSMIVMTAPLVLPLIDAAGFDLVWFGIYLVVMIELAQVTPPVGFNLFVISGLNNDDLFTIAKAAFPFFLIMLLASALLTVFPDIALYLPSRMK